MDSVYKVTVFDDNGKAYKVSLNADHAIDIAQLKNLPGRYKLALDAGSFLQVLADGCNPGWVGGGDWKSLKAYLDKLAEQVRKTDLELSVFFHGSISQEEWNKNQKSNYETAYKISQHVFEKKRSPNKELWIPPPFLRSSIRLALGLSKLRIDVRCTSSKFGPRKEVANLIKELSIDGLITDDPFYFAFRNIKRYFSSRSIRISNEDSECKLKVAEFNLKKFLNDVELSEECFRFAVALFVNRSNTDFRDFFISLKIRQNEKDCFNELVHFVKSLRCSDAMKFAQQVSARLPDKISQQKLCGYLYDCLKYYGHAFEERSLVSGSGSHVRQSTNVQNLLPQSYNPVAFVRPIPVGNPPLQYYIPPLLPNMGQYFNSNIQYYRMNGVPPGINPAVQTVANLLFKLDSEIVQIGKRNHENGFFSPYIYQLLSQREFRLEFKFCDLPNEVRLPGSRLLYMPLRQKIYGILFNVSRAKLIAGHSAIGCPIATVKEIWYDALAGKEQIQSVNAEEIRENPSPTLKELWFSERFGVALKDKKTLFLKCMNSEELEGVPSTSVPERLLILCCVLRYMLGQGKVLTLDDLDAFLLQGLFLNLATEMGAEIKHTNDFSNLELTTDGIHLGHLFMEGVEMAHLANDACGRPVSAYLFLPWCYFDGTLFSFIRGQIAAGRCIHSIFGGRTYNLESGLKRLKHVVIRRLTLDFPSSLPEGLSQNISNVENCQGNVYLYNRTSNANNSSQSGSGQIMRTRRFCFAVMGSIPLMPHSLDPSTANDVSNMERLNLGDDLCNDGK